MKKYFILFTLIPIIVIAFSWKLSLTVFAAKPSDFGLKEGDLISAIFSSDPDVYIINAHGYKRLFLNPEIFKFYAHLGGFANVKLVTPEIRNAFPTSGLFRDCETNDQKVYGIQVEGEDKGELHWINTSGEQAVKDDPDFFKKVFCINNKEFKWYRKAEALNSVKEIPQYSRVAVPAIPAIPAVPASPSQPFIPSITPKPASGSFSPTPIPTFITQPATPATPAVPTQPISTTASISHTPTPTPIPTPTPVPATAYANCGERVKNVPAQYSTIQAAIDASSPGDTVKVAAGTYSESLEVKSGICLDGAGVDQTNIVAGPYRLTPSGLAINQVVTFRTSYVIIRNLTIKNNNSTNYEGGGIRIIESNNILVESCHLTQNNVLNGGGMLIERSTNIRVNLCLIDNNYARNAGGGVVVEGDSEATFTNVTIANNSAGGVGGLAFGSLSLNITNSIFWGNSGYVDYRDCCGYVGSTNLAVNAKNRFGLPNTGYSVNSSDIGGWSSGTGNISLDPQFVNSTDFHLKSTSPASGMGVYPVTSTPTPTPTPVPTASVSFSPTPTPTPTPTPQTRILLAITSISETNITDSSAVINFTTNNPANFTLYYGLTANFGLTIRDLTNFSTSRNITLSNLQPNTTYRYMVEMADATNSQTSSAVRIFTTLGTISGSSTTQFSFFRNLTTGSTGNDVKQLQALLVNEVSYPTDLITGYFGSITRDAVKRLQEKYGIKPISGYFGEITRKTLRALVSQ